MAVFNRGLLRDKTGDFRGAISDYSTVLAEYPDFWPVSQYRSQARRKTGDLKGAEEDEFKVLKAQIEAQNGTKKQTASNDKTRKKSDKNVENYRKIVVADNDSEDDRYKTGLPWKGAGQECDDFATADVLP